QASLIQNVHPDSGVRSAAEMASQKAEALSTEMSLNRKLYDALAAIDLAGANAETRYYVEKTLRDFRLAGVDKDDATRANIRTLKKLIAKRAELAQLLAYPSFADYVTADKMVGNQKNAAAFIDQVVSASGPRAETEYRTLLDRKKQDVADASVVNAWETA